MKRLRRLHGVWILIAALAFVYWCPVIWWLATTLANEGASLPNSVPFGSLVARTLLVSLVAAVGSTALAYPVALVWRLASSPWQSRLTILMVLPVVMGALARNYSWRGMLASREGFSSLGLVWLHGNALQYTQASVFIVMVYVFVPIAFFILIQGSAAAGQDLVDAARTMGATENRILFSVVCPHMNRAAVLSTGLVLTMASGYFITPQMIGGSKVPLMGNAVYMYVNQGQFGVAGVIALWFLLTMLPFVVVVVLWSVRKRMLATGR